MSIDLRECQDYVEELERRIKELEGSLEEWVLDGKSMTAAAVARETRIAELEARLDAVAKVQRFNNVNESYVMLPANEGLWVRYSDVLIALEARDE